MVWVESQTQQLQAGGFERGGLLGLEQLGIHNSSALNSFCMSKQHSFLLCGMLIRRYGSGFPSRCVFASWKDLWEPNGVFGLGLSSMGGTISWF